MVKSRYQLTARWIKVFTSALSDVTDIIEINQLYYFMVDPTISDDQALQDVLRAFSGEVIERNTLKDIILSGDPFHLEPILTSRFPDKTWDMIEEAIEIKCCCGSDVVYGKNNKLHMSYCDKYDKSCYNKK